MQIEGGEGIETVIKQLQTELQDTKLKSESQRTELQGRVSALTEELGQEKSAAAKLTHQVEKAAEEEIQLRRMLEEEKQRAADVEEKLKAQVTRSKRKNVDVFQMYRGIYRGKYNQCDWFNKENSERKV